MFRKKYGLIALLLCIVLTVGYFAINTGAVSTVLLAIQGAITDGNLVKFSGTNGIGVDTGLSATNVADAVTKKHAQNSDTDLDADFEATFVKKADTVNVLSDITSAGADIEDAVTKKHTQNTDTALGTLTADVNMETHKLTGLSVPVSSGDSIRATTKITETNLESAVDHKDLTNDPHNVTKAQVDLDNVENLKVKLDATAAPGVSNDNTEGYAVGSRWIDITNDKEYVALDVSTGEAVWTETTQSGDGAGTYLELTDTPAAYEDGKYAKSTADGVVWDTPAGAGDMLEATYDTDEDGDIDVAAGGTEKSSWTLYAIPYLSGTTAFGEIPIGTAGQLLKVSAGATGYEFGNESDPTVDSDAKIKAILVDEVTKTGDFTAGRIAKINNATGIIEQGTNTDTEVSDAVTKRHTQNTDTALGTQTQDLNMGTHKIIGVVDPVNPQDAATKAYADTKVAIEVDPTVDTDAKIKAILVDEITKTGTFTAGRLPEIDNSTGIIKQSDIEHKANGGYDFNINSAGFTTQTTTGDGTTTCDWRIGLKFRFLFGAQNETFTFTNPEFSCHLQIILIQDATGSRIVTWPAGIFWAGGTIPTLSTAANARDIVNLFFDDYDDVYYGMGADFAVP